MARPKKVTVDYFNHDCLHGKTIEILEDEFGIEGYAAWFKLLERLGRSDHHFIDVRDELDWRYLKSQIKVTDLEKILNTMASIKAIDPELWAERIIYSEKFVERLKDAYQYRQSEYPVKSLVLSLLAINRVNCLETRVNYLETPETGVNDINNQESESESESNNPLPQQAGENNKKLRNKGLNPRAQGTSPRQLAEKQKHLQKIQSRAADPSSYYNSREKAELILKNSRRGQLEDFDLRLLAEIEFFHDFSPQEFGVMDDARGDPRYEVMTEQVRKEFKDAGLDKKRNGQAE
jgi:hypothetical protein